MARQRVHWRINDGRQAYRAFHTQPESHYSAMVKKVCPIPHWPRMVSFALFFGPSTLSKRTSYIPTRKMRLAATSSSASFNLRTAISWTLNAVAARKCLHCRRDVFCFSLFLHYFICSFADFLLVTKLSSNELFHFISCWWAVLIRYFSLMYGRPIAQLFSVTLHLRLFALNAAALSAPLLVAKFILQLACASVRSLNKQSEH